MEGLPVWWREGGCNLRHVGGWHGWEAKKGGLAKTCRKHGRVEEPAEVKNDPFPVKKNETVLLRKAALAKAF